MGEGVLGPAEGLLPRVQRDLPPLEAPLQGVAQVGLLQEVLDSEEGIGSTRLVEGGGVAGL